MGDKIMSERSKSILGVFVLIFTIFIIVFFAGNNHTFFVFVIVLFFVFIVISGKIQKSSNRRQLYERLGISSEDELSAVLSEFDVLVSDKLYIRNGLIVNIDSYKSYHLYEIKNVEKRNITHRNRTMSYETYELIIYTETTTDTLYYYTNKSGRDCAYLLLVRKISESKSRTAKVTSQDIISNELAYSSDDYEGMIMDDEDIEDRESRSDWLG